MDDGSFRLYPFLVGAFQDNAARLLRVLLSDVIDGGRVVRRDFRVFIRLTFFKDGSHVAFKVGPRIFLVLVHHGSDNRRQVRVSRVSGLFWMEWDQVVRASEHPPQVPCRSRPNLVFRHGVGVVALVFGSGVSFLVNFQLATCLFRRDCGRLFHASVLRIFLYRAIRAISAFFALVASTGGWGYGQPRYRYGGDS